MCKVSKPDFDLPTVQLMKKGDNELMPLYSNGVFDGAWSIVELPEDVLLIRCSGVVIAVSAEKVWQVLKGLKKGKNK